MLVHGVIIVTMMNLVPKINFSRIVCGIILFASVLFTTACSDNSVTSLTGNDMSENNSYISSVTDTIIPKLDTPSAIQTTESDNLHGLLKSYITFAKSKCGQALKNGTECMISLQDIFDDAKPEMILGIKSDYPIYEGEYYFTVDESEKPFYMGCCDYIHDEFYTDGEYVYAVKTDNLIEEKNIAGISFNKVVDHIDASLAPDLAEYTNTDALEFIYETHMFFLRYDNEDWDSEKQSWNDPEKTAALFYCEDSGLYEVHMVSERMLDLTGIEIGMLINDEGNLIPAYGYLSGNNYLISKQEYEYIWFEFFEMLTEVTEEPEISSGWIDIEDVDKWIDSLA